MVKATKNVKTKCPVITSAELLGIWGQRFLREEFLEFYYLSKRQTVTINHYQRRGDHRNAVGLKVEI